MVNVNSVCPWSLPSPKYHYARLRRQRLYCTARKRGKIRGKLQPHKARFPFHRLPREIITEIFVLCLPGIKRYYCTEYVKSKGAAPLLLCNVCSSWRSLALNTRRLWNQLSIEIKKPQTDINTATTMAETWIARSGELPLSLRLHVDVSFDKKVEAHATSLADAYLNIFFRYASRWELIAFGVGHYSTVSFPKFGPTPLLRDFSYSTMRRVSDPFPFTSCPLLSTVDWPFSCFPSSNPEIPWYQLTDITLDITISSHEIFDILGACQMVVRLDVAISDDSSFDRLRSSRRTPVENRTLRYFRMVVYQMASGLFHCLTLPALAELIFDNDSDESLFISARSLHTQLLRLFTRSKCKLKTLTLGNCGFDDDQILKFFKHDSCSTLTELEISNASHQAMFTDEVILALTDKDGPSEDSDNVLLPGLSELRFCSCVSASPGMLGFMIVTRSLWWDKDKRLKSLQLDKDDVPDDMDSAFLEFAEEGGLDVRYW